MSHQLIHDPVLLTDPVNRQHPLARGLVAWWLTVPGLDGGSKWYDLVGMNHGTLTGMGNANNGWRASTREGGLGHITFDASSGRVVVPNSDLLNPQNSGFTITLWANLKNFSNTGRLFAKSNMYRAFVRSGSGSLGLDVYNNSGDQVRLEPGVFLTTNNWYLLSFWHDPLTNTIGFSINNGTARTISFTGPVASNTNSLEMGSEVGGSLLGCDMDDVRFYHRKLSLTEIGDIYNTKHAYQLLRGEPTIRRFVTPFEIFVPTGGTIGRGSATAWVTSNYSPTAGSLAGGSSKIAANYLLTPLGCVIVNGAGQLNAAYQPVIVGGGGIGGSAFYHTFAETETAGGCATSGTSSATVVYTVPTSGGAGSAGSAQLGSGATASGGARGGGSAISTLLFQPVAQGGVRGAGQASNFSTFIEQATVGAAIRGVAVINSIVSPVVAGGIQLNGGAALTLNATFEVSGGAIANGTSHAGASYLFSSTGGAHCGGAAPWRTTFTNLSRLRYHRFRVGDIVYVPSPTQGDSRYLKQTVRAMFSWNGEAAYKNDLGWFPDRLVLSQDQYRAWLRRRGRNRHALR